jgi:hypothetical protein
MTHVRGICDDADLVAADEIAGTTTVLATGEVNVAARRPGIPRVGGARVRQAGVALRSCVEHAAICLYARVGRRKLGL